jgi:hypothetical protein
MLARPQVNTSVRRNGDRRNKEAAMTEVPIIRNTGAEDVLREAAVAELKGHLRGRLLRAGDEGYEAARRIWNGMIDKRPALIAR